MNLDVMVVSKATRMPVHCWGRYKRCAIVIVDRDALPAKKPRMISERARGVVAIVEEHDKLHVGRADSGRCAWRTQERECEDRLGPIFHALRSTPAKLLDATDRSTLQRVHDYVHARRNSDSARESARRRIYCSKARRLLAA